MLAAVGSGCPVLGADRDNFRDSSVQRQSPKFGIGISKLRPAGWGLTVNEPRTAVEQADALVSEMIKRLSDVFADERAGLEKHWGRGENVSTEDLRIALKRYRSFFERLLHV